MAGPGWHTPTNFVAGTVVTEAMLDDLSQLLTNGAMVPIQEIILTSAGANLDFLSIPQTFRSLLVCASVRGDAAQAQTNISIRFNNDSGANYANQYLAANFTTPVSSDGVGISSIALGAMSAGTAPAGYASPCFALIPNYSLSVLHKNTIAMSGYRSTASSGAQSVQVTFGSWQNTAAITRLTILPAVGNFAIGSAVQLFGLPGLG